MPETWGKWKAAYHVRNNEVADGFVLVGRGVDPQGWGRAGEAVVACLVRMFLTSGL